MSSDQLTTDASDQQILALAKRINAVVLTIDMDFANILTYPPPHYDGIIVLRYQLVDQDQLDTMLEYMLAEEYPHGIRHKLIIVTRDRYRVRG